MINYTSLEDDEISKDLWIESFHEGEGKYILTVVLHELALDEETVSLNSEDELLESALTLYKKWAYRIDPTNSLLTH